jgi:lysophospholipase L1-like esterase
MAGPQADFRSARARYTAWLGTDEAQIAVRGPAPIDVEAAPDRPAGAAPPGVAEGVAAWADAARNLRAICAWRRIPLVHALQPGLDDVGSKPASPEEMRTNALSSPWRESIRTGYPLLRASRDALEREGVPVRDGSRLFAERTETLYVDGCHLNDRGYEIYGLEVAGWIQSALDAR